ncbi:MAG: ornithine carbamoyltransferase [Thermodesulfobacteria bacterium]|nr:ornithine carbamoyltransferase [Thermodesulfobacteriota bacterium]
MKLRHFLRVWDFSKDEAQNVIERALELKSLQTLPKTLDGKILGLLFEKPSTRTRVSFESAMLRLGGQSIYLPSRELQLSRGEPVKDTARVLSSYLDAVVLRTYSHDTVEEFARYSTIPVINGLTDKHHPCQALSDVMTVIESGIDLGKAKIAWIGDGNNVCQSWLEASALFEFEFVIACPEGYEPDAELVKEAKEKYHAKVIITHDPEEAVRDADAVNTDVWVSMGQEKEAEDRKKVFGKYQVNQELLKLAKPTAVVLHCLPAHRGEEITEEVLEGSQSVVWRQAENKMWLHMALLEFLLVKS